MRPKYRRGEKSSALDTFMAIAIGEARQSLKEGNSGFGAVIARGEEIIAQAHDTDTKAKDPTAHAETNAIREAAGITVGNLTGCMLISTHEPCPMCSAAIVW